MSGVYRPGAFKKLKEEKKLVENGYVPNPINQYDNKWGDRTTFVNLIKGTEEKIQKNEKDNSPITALSLPIIKSGKMSSDFKKFIRINGNKLEEIYKEMIEYDKYFLDKLRVDRNGLDKFMEFVFSVI